MSPAHLVERLRRRVAARGQGGFVIIAGLAVWMLVGGVLMIALLDMTFSATRQASIGSLRSQQTRALDAALETAVAGIQIDPSGRVGLPTGKDDGGCASGLGPAGEGLTYDDGMDNTVLVTMACWGSTKKDEPHRVELTATMVGPGAPARMTAGAELEVVAAKGPGNDVTILSWNLATPQVLPGDTTTTTSVPTTSTSTTTTTTPPVGITWSSKVFSEWQTGQCVDVTVTNGGGSSAEWSVTVPVKGTIYEFWSASYTRSGDELTASGLSWNRTLRSGESTSFGWCTNFPATTTTTTTTPPDDITWTSRITSDWGAGQCVEVTVRNQGESSQRWTVTVPVKGTIYTFWSGRYTRSGDSMSVTGESWNQTLRSDESTTFGWCANF